MRRSAEQSSMESRFCNEFGSANNCGGGGKVPQRFCLSGVPGLEVAQWQSFCGGAEKVGNRSRTGSAHIPRYSIGSGKVP